MQAYVFVTAAPKANPRQVAEAMRRVSGIKSADLCWGVPDIIAFAEAADMKALETVVIEQLQKIPGVERTDTHILAGS